MASTKTPIGAEQRGKLRQLKRKLTAALDRAEKAIYSAAAQRDVEALTLRNSSIGRSRALQRLCKAAGPGAYLERAAIDGPFPRVTWMRLVPRNAVVVDAADPGLRQDNVVAEYLIAGALVHRGGDITAGLWTLEFTDHSLGRMLQRSPHADPVNVMVAAHRNILKARVDDLRAVMSTMRGTFLLPAGPGAFVCEVICGPDQSLGNSHSMFVTARTYLDADMLFETQVSIAVDARDGESRMGDSFLLPFPLRRMTAEGEPGNRLIAVEPIGDVVAGRLH